MSVEQFQLAPLTSAGEGGAQRRDSGDGRVRGRLRRYATLAGGLVAGLVALDLIGFVATVYFGAELLKAAEAAGVAGLLPR